VQAGILPLMHDDDRCIVMTSQRYAPALHTQDSGKPTWFLRVELAVTNSWRGGARDGSAAEASRASRHCSNILRTRQVVLPAKRWGEKVRKMQGV
jgi:hypothetical protein